MSDKPKFGLAGFSFVLAIGFALFSGLSSKTEAEPILNGRQQIQAMPPPHQNSIEPAAHAQLCPTETEQAVSGSPGNRIAGGPGAGTPGWTIPYGKEFWRRANKPAEPKPKHPTGSSAMISANIDLGDIIDRVSHAITKNDSSAVPRVQAKTYTAAFDSAGVHFSPHRPQDSEFLTAKDSLLARLAPGPKGNENDPGASAAAGGFDRGQTGPRDGIAPVENRRDNRQSPLPDPDTEVTLRTRSVRLGDRVLYEPRDRALSWSLLGNTCQALLNERIGLVEHYEAGGEGVQVSWVLKERPAGEGALEIEFEMEGLSYVGASDRGLHLADATGTPRIRIGKAIAVDSLGRRSEVALVANAGRFFVRVSGEILAHATYPLAIDPLISPEFGMDEPVIVPELGFHQCPVVAWNGTNWLVVWTEWLHLFDSPVDVVGARVSSEGRVLDPFGILISKDNPPPASPAVASNGRDFLVVWEHFDFTTLLDVYGVRVTADGQVADQDKIVISRLPGDQFSPSVAGGSEGYVVVWQERRSGSDLDIYGTRVSSEAVVMDGDGIRISTAPGDQFSPSIARGPNGFLVVWSDAREFSSGGADIFGTRLDRNGTVLDTNGIAVCTASKSQGFPCVAAGPTGYLVVWLDLRNSTGDVEQNDIYGTLVTPAGVVSIPQGIAVSTASGDQTRPSVAAGAAGFLVVWKDSRAIQPGLYASRVSPAGTVLDSEGVLVDPGKVSFAPTVAAYDSGFLVVWDQVGGTYGTSILGTRLNNRAEVIDAEGILITAKDNDQNSPAIASNGTNWLVVWADGRSLTNGSDIYGVRIGYDGSALDTAAIPISSQPGFEFVPAVASAGGDYLVVWTDNRNFPYDIYGARVRADGTVVDPDGIAISTAPGFQLNPAVTSDGTNYLVAWQDGRGTNTSHVYAARMNRDGVVLDPDGFPVSAHGDAQGWPAAAFNGKDFLVVWTQAHESVEHHGDIWGARVSTDGMVLDPATISISRAPNAQNLPAVASAGSDFLVIWADTRNTVTTNGSTFVGEIYGARVNADGRVLDPDGFLVSTAAFRAYPALAFNGTDFLAAWDNRIPGVTGPTTEIRAAWIDRNGSVLLGDLTANTNGAYPVVAAGPPNTFLAVSEGVRNGASRIVGNLISLADAPTMQSLTLAEGVATLAWYAEPGRTYRAQFKPDLRDTNWIDLEPVVTATNIAVSILDPTIGQAPQRFYRVLQLP